MRRTMTIMLAAAALVATATPVADAGISRARLSLRRTRVGSILVNSSGFTLYAFTRDGRDKNECVRISGCTGVWPMVTTGGRAVAGPGVNAALIGTIALDGVKQVTYAGHPLYTYIGDRSPGQTSYVNVDQFGGRWPAVNARGGEVS